jgi:hypothetical protein
VERTLGSSNSADDAAPFLLRLAALAIDAAILVGAVAATVEGANALFGPTLVPFWRDEAPVSVEVRHVDRANQEMDDGTHRQAEWRWEYRRYADGSMRVFAVLAGTLTHPDGRVERLSNERKVGENLGYRWRLRATWALAWAIPFAYFAAFEASPWQGSPGKRCLGLKVADRTGRRFGLGRSLLRQAMKCFEMTLSGLGYVLAAFTPRRQAFHDFLAGTLVLKAGPAERSLDACRNSRS